MEDQKFVRSGSGSTQAAKSPPAQIAPLSRMAGGLAPAVLPESSPGQVLPGACLARSGSGGGRGTITWSSRASTTLQSHHATDATPRAGSGENGGAGAGSPCRGPVDSPALLLLAAPDSSESPREAQPGPFLSLRDIS
jgi:hypothetical protein